jgi:hypothetical protein
MSSINDKDAQLLYKIASELHEAYNHIFSQIDHSMESYYIDRSKCLHKELEELDFDTPVELKKYLEELWAAEKESEMKRFIPVILAATFKRYPSFTGKDKTNLTATAQKLPEFVYNF